MSAHKNVFYNLIVLSLAIFCLASCTTKIRSTTTMPPQGLAEPKRVFVAADIAEVFDQNKAEGFKETIENGFEECKVKTKVVLIPPRSKKLTLEEDTSSKTALEKSMNEYKPDYILEIRPTESVVSGAMLIKEVVRAKFTVHLATYAKKRPVWSEFMNIEPKIYGNDGIYMAENILQELKSANVLRNCEKSAHN